MGVTNDELREIERQYDRLGPNDRRQLVVYLLYYFSESARMNYVEAGHSEAEAAKRLRAMNEVVQVLSKQALVMVGAKEPPFAYPADALFEVLVQTMEIGCPEREAFLGPVYDAFRQVLRPQSG